MAADRDDDLDRRILALFCAASLRAHSRADDFALCRHDRGAGCYPRHPAQGRARPYFNIGASQIMLPGLKGGIEAYYKIVSNLLDEGQFGAPILLTPFNYEKGLVRGVELTLSYDIENWSFYGNF